MVKVIVLVIPAPVTLTLYLLGLYKRGILTSPLELVVALTVLPAILNIIS